MSSPIMTAPAAGSVQLRNVSKAYLGRRDIIQAVEDVSLSIRPGEVVSLVGPSGCGKSTLLKIVGGLVPFGGDLSINEERLSGGPHPDVGFMFQSPVLFPWRTVLSNVLLPARIRGQVTDDVRERARELLDMVGISEFEGVLPRELSGGMQQRVALCRTLLNDPHILLLDEPFASLDEFTRERLNLELLEIQARSRKTVVFVTHNVVEATFMSDRVFVMTPRPGRIKGEIAIDLPRPRATAVMKQPEFTDRVFAIRELLGLDEVAS